MTLSPACSGGPPEDAAHKSAGMKTQDSLPLSDPAERLASGNCFYSNILVSLSLSGKTRGRVFI